MDRGICRLPTIHTLCRIHWLCCYCVLICVSWFLLVTWRLLHLSILERDPPLLLSWRFLPFFSLWRVVWELFLIRCEVKGQGCLCVRIVKHSETHFLFVKMGYTNKLNWMKDPDLNKPRVSSYTGRWSGLFITKATLLPEYVFMFFHKRPIFVEKQLIISFSWKETHCFAAKMQSCPKSKDFIINFGIKRLTNT